MQCSHCRIDIVMIVGDGIDHVVGCGRDGLVSTRRATHTQVIADGAMICRDGAGRTQGMNGTIEKSNNFRVNSTKKADNNSKKILI